MFDYRSGYYKRPALFLVLACLMLLGAGCAGSGGSGGVVIQEQTKKAAAEGSEKGCAAGTARTVVGRTYTVIGSESHVIQGKSYELCCWGIGDGKNQKKICSDGTAGPVGYDHGVLFENDKNTGDQYKSMETYREGGRVCQQFYDVDGTTGPLNCQERVN